MIVSSAKEDEDFFCEKTSYRAGPEFRGIKLVEDGKILAMVGYDFWTENAVQMHVWFGDSSAALKGRVFLHEVFRYPFELCGRGLVIGVTPAHNAASLRFQRFLGFEEKYRIQNGWAIGDDLVLSELKKENCVWLRALHVNDSSSVDGSPDGAADGPASDDGGGVRSRVDPEPRIPSSASRRRPYGRGNV